MKRIYLIIPLVAAALLIVGSVAAQGPQSNGPQASIGSTFMYQGQLKLNGTPVTHQCAFTFKLFDNWYVGANQIGGAINQNINVVNGLFAAGLDFGRDALTGEVRYLDITVDCGGGAQTLSPRQLITAAPYAMSLMPGAVISGTATAIISATNTSFPGDALVGTSTNFGNGVVGLSPTGKGVRGQGEYGVYGEGTTGVYGLGTFYGVHGSSVSGYAGYFDGATHINGPLYADSLQIGGSGSFNQIDSGTATLGSSLTASSVFTVTFQAFFSSTPRVLATVRGNDYSDVFAVTTRRIAADHFVINVLRLDQNSGWGQNLQLDWLAWN